MIISRCPKGWTGPKSWNGEPIEGSSRAHVISIPVELEDMEQLDLLAGWLKSYHPEELFDENGKLISELAALPPKGDKRMAANPMSNGGLDPKPLVCSDYRK